MTDLSRLEPDWTIRPFLPGDARAARRLVESVWHEHFHRHPDPFVRDFIYTGLSDVDCAQTAYGDRALFLCAVSEGEIVGTGAIKRLDDRECEMARMFVASACRNRGIGRAMADQLIGFARTAGYDRIRLSSNNSLTASHRLYERLGFQPVPAWEPGGETHSRYYALGIANP
jgi:ribosomal protein S18 acetylase RimI-like enzyme